MPPNTKEVVQEVWDQNGPDKNKFEKLVAPQAGPWDFELEYTVMSVIVTVHLFGLYGLYLLSSAKLATLGFTFIYLVTGILGITAGAHRYWSHKSYKAKLPLEILLMLWHSSVNQFSVIWWVQNHRQHHKFSDTDADPHNPTRGLFFAHCGWLFVRRHPDLIKRRQLVHISDIRNNAVLSFQKKYAIIIITTMAVILPTALPLLWGENLTISWHLNMLRLAITYNLTFIVNSIAHRWGYKPYDKNIVATQSDVMSLLTLGEGYHNFHHTFPWDYRSGELGNMFNFTTFVINMFAKIGWAYDLKSVSKDMIEMRAKRTGDGSRVENENYEKIR